MNRLSLDPDACYAAFSAHDARFDGRFFVGISSTGIYCRPICRVKRPKKGNCGFYESAAAAEAAGFRPCLRCRPELAPGFAPVDAPARLARRAAALMDEDGCENLADLAARLSVSARHLRRVFIAEYGVPPVKYLRTRRLLLARNLLMGSRISVIDAAFAAGFGSLRAFNEVFKAQYRSTPSAVRRLASANDGADAVALTLGYRPPYAWDDLLAFLAARAVPGVEIAAGGRYLRAVELESGGAFHRGWFAAENFADKNALRVTFSPSLLPALPKFSARVKRFFDLDCGPAEVYDKLSGLDEMKPGLRLEGLRLPGAFDGFEMSARAVLGQQITVKAARTLAGRLAENFGRPIDTPFDDLRFTFPGPAVFAAMGPQIADHLGPIGVTGARARSILGLAEAVLAGRLNFSPGADPEAECAALSALPGFGPWTVQYVAMRALGWPDAFPHTDYGVKKALPGLSPAEILETARAWRPWRSYATLMLWRSLE